MRRAILMVVVAVATVGCDNSCQAFCQTLADYADECGAPFSASEVSDCQDDFESAAVSERRTCLTYGQPDVLRREWSCDDVTLYRAGGGAPSDDTDG